MSDTVRYIVTVKGRETARSSITDEFVREISGNGLHPDNAIGRVLDRLGREEDEDFYLYDEVDVSLRRTR